MPSAPFPIITDGCVGDVPIGFYMAPDSIRKYVLKGCPGLLEHCQFANCTEGRGIHPWNNYLYCVLQRGSQSVVFRLDSAGNNAELGTITTSSTGPVWMKNNSTQLGISDGTSMYVYTPSTGLFVQNTDLDFPGSSALDYQDGLGLYVKPNSNQWGFTDLYNFLSITALNFYSFESKTGNIVGLICFMREPYILGQEGAEVWYFYGGDNSSADNPTFARNTAGVIEYGCGAAGTPNIADGTTPNWLSNQGQWVAAMGYQAQVVSNQMFDNAVKAMPIYSDARCFSWRDGGHVFTAMTFPTGNQTWVMDWTTKERFKMQSYLDDGSGYGRHRLNCICKMNNVLYGLDYSNGRAYKVSTDYKDDNGYVIRRVLTTTEWDGGNEDLDFGPLRLLMKMGVGLSGATNPPYVMRSFSIDSGKTWSPEQWRSAGEIGEYKLPPPIWSRNGQSRKRMERFAFTDAVEWEIWGIDYPITRLQG